MYYAAERTENTLITVILSRTVNVISAKYSKLLLKAVRYSRIALHALKCDPHSVTKRSNAKPKQSRNYFRHSIKNLLL